jgi:hypothetical protein
MVIKKNDVTAVQKFEDYILERLAAQGDGQLRNSSELRKSVVAPEQLAAARARHDLSFTSDFFMYHIDKFFSFELNVVLTATDDEYARYQAQNKQADDEFQRQIEDLDDYFLNDSPRVQGEEALQQQLERTVKDYERSLTENRSPAEKQELEAVIKTLKSKINDLERKASQKQMTERASTIQTTLDINELRKRGI